MSPIEVPTNEDLGALRYATQLNESKIDALTKRVEALRADHDDHLENSQHALMTMTERARWIQTRLDALEGKTPDPEPDPTPDPTPISPPSSGEPPTFTRLRAGILRDGASGTMGAVAYDHTTDTLLVAGRKNDPKVYRYSLDDWKQIGDGFDPSDGALEQILSGWSTGGGYGGLLVLRDGRIAYHLQKYYNTSGSLYVELGIWDPKTGARKLLRSAGEARGTYGHQVFGGPLASYVDESGKEWIACGWSEKQGSAASSHGGSLILIDPDRTVMVAGEECWDDRPLTWRTGDNPEPGHNNVRELDGRVIVGDWHVIFGSRGKSDVVIYGDPPSGVGSKGYHCPDGYTGAAWFYRLSDQLNAESPHGDTWERELHLDELIPESAGLTKRHSVIGATWNPQAKEVYLLVAAAEGSYPLCVVLGVE